MEEFPGKCPHMGCKLEKNADDHTWECPCHGSCFTAEGELVSGPAQHGLTADKDKADKPVSAPEIPEP